MTALHTDLYEIRMAVSYLRRGMTGPATFSLFARTLPAERGFLVAAGLEPALEFLEGFRFDEAEIDYLREVPGMSAQDLRALAGLRFEGDVLAVPEGRVVTAAEPLLEVTAPLAQAQLVETALLNFVTYSTAVATKATRCRLAAGDAELIDFGARRTHGPDAAFLSARACAIAGFSGTSHVASARRYGLRPVGTMAHSYVQVFDSEARAFRAFAQDFPRGAVFLVDTFDTGKGVETAIEVIRALGLPAAEAGVRLDSGDLADLARTTRRMLDRAGMPRARIVASGGLDEYELDRLRATGAPIDVFGVGTKVGVSADAPSLDTAYKLVEYEGRPVMKLSVGKVSAPGAKQVHRGPRGLPDLLALRSEAARDDREPLLVRVMSEGRRLGGGGAIDAARKCLDRDLSWLPDAAKRLRAPEPIVAVATPSLTALAAELGSARSPQRRG